MPRLVVTVALLAVLGCGRRNFNEDAAVVDGITVDADTCTGAPVGCADPITYTCGGTCYVRCTNPSARPAAAAACADWGGCLATADDPVANNCTAAHVLDVAWIGVLQANSATTPGEGWAWCDGSPLTFTGGWRASEPNDSVGTETGGSQCAFIDTGGAWNDDVCAATLSFVCSRPL